MLENGATPSYGNHVTFPLILPYSEKVNRSPRLLACLASRSTLIGNTVAAWSASERPRRLPRSNDFYSAPKAADTS
jgi:hypothetical protein